MKKLVLLSLFFCIALVFGINIQSSAQEKTTKPVAKVVAKPADPSWGIKLYGFLRNDIMFDTRQITASRENELSLYPKDKLLDASGSDINAASTFNMLSITSRLGGTITGPEAFGAKTSGVLEAEFFGNFEIAPTATTAQVTGSNEFRLRHAYAKLDWPKTQLAFGQFWNPMFVTDCFPGTVNFNTGIPFQPFNRSPQVRLTQKLDKANKVSLILAMLSQRDFANTAPAGYEVTAPARNGSIPNLHAQLQYKTDKILLGAGIDYKSLRPKLSSGTPVVVSKEKVNSSAMILYTKITTKPVIFKAQATIGSNLTDQTMIGGYLGYIATVGAIETYSATKTNAYWVDISSTSKKVIPGIFIGYTNNDGVKSSVTSPVTTTAYGRGIAVNGRGIKNVFRVSPRLEFVSGKFKFASEIEYTEATYGTMATDAVVNGTTDKFNNTRLLLTTTFSF